MSASTALPVEELHGPPPQVVMVQLLAGFQVSQALYAIAKLDVATALVDGPRPVAELAAAAGAKPEPLRRLLRTLAGLGLFTEVLPGTYAVTPLGATLAAGTPGSVRNLALTWMETHYAPFARLVDTLRTGVPAATQHYGRPFFEWLAGDREQVDLFTGAMADLTEGIRAATVVGYRLPPGEVVADIGAADGALLLKLLAADPEPRRGVVFDLPHVVPAAHARLADHPLRDRVDVVAGDFFAAVPPADLYVLSMILHDWDDASCTRLLGRIAQAARPGARLVSLELIVPPGDTPHMSTMIDLTMLGMLTGRERTAEELAELLASAEIRLDKIVPTLTPMSVLEATIGG